MGNVRGCAVGIIVLAASVAPLAAQQGNGRVVRSVVEAGPSVSINVPGFKDEEARWQLAAAAGLVAEGERDAFGGAVQVVIDKSLIQGALQARYHRRVSEGVSLLAAAGPILYANADADLDLTSPGWTVGLTGRHRSGIGLTVRFDVLPVEDGPGSITPGARRTYRSVAVALQADGRPGAVALAAGLLIALLAGGGWN